MCQFEPIAKKKKKKKCFKKRSKQCAQYLVFAVARVRVERPAIGARNRKSAENKGSQNVLARSAWWEKNTKKKQKK
jgi:hypothetical protein